MKTTLLSVFALVVGITASAQKASYVPSNKANFTLPATYVAPEREPAGSTKLFQPGDGPKTDLVYEEVIGQTTYDLQSNSGIQNRIYAYPDGTIGAVWTQGYLSGASYSDRGTGYNYFNGTSWGAIPTARIPSETAKCGWPSYAPLGAGEMVICHKSVGALNFTKRAAKGTGAWTTVDIPGTTNYAWPRAITNGNTIHLIVNTYALYQGLTNALVYMRSLNGGTTWSAPVVLPGLDAASLPIHTVGFTGFGGDEYAWAAPHGDTIAFAVGHNLGGIWIMKSFDNGTTWTRTTAYEFPQFTGTVSPAFTTFDEIFAIALDNVGKVHMVTTRYGIASYDATVPSWNYYPTTDGIVYWNEDMPKIDTAIYNYPDSLIAHGMWLGSMIDYDNNGTIDFPDAGTGNVPWGDYRYVGPSSFPQICIDKSNNMFVSYSALREDLVNTGASPTIQLYRHLYTVSKLAGQTTWSDPVDLNDDIIHSYDEVVWATMVLSNDGKMHFLCQMDPEPGTSIGADLDAPGDNYMTYINFPTFVSTKPADVSKDVNVSPNPASDYADVKVTLKDSQKVTLNVFDVMGRLIASNNYGEMGTGSHTFKVNTENLPSGMYVFSVQVGTSQTSKKVIVK